MLRHNKVAVPKNSQTYRNPSKIKALKRLCPCFHVYYQYLSTFVIELCTDIIYRLPKTALKAVLYLDKQDYGEGYGSDICMDYKF